MKKTRKIVALALLSTAFLTSCSVSSETKDTGKDVICAASNGLVAKIRTSDSVAKFVAGVVKDNSTGNIKKVSEEIIRGKGGAKAADELSDYVKKLCSK